MSSQDMKLSEASIKEIIRLLAENNRILKENHDIMVRMEENVRKIRANTN